MPEIRDECQPLQVVWVQARRLAGIKIQSPEKIGDRIGDTTIIHKTRKRNNLRLGRAAKTLRQFHSGNVSPQKR